MCLLLIAHRVHPKYPLVLAANRDEFYVRPTDPLAFWPGEPHVLAGRDLQGGGTWLGITRKGRLAAVTNYREPKRKTQQARSRGLLIHDFLTGCESPLSFLNHIRSQEEQYSGFNLIVGDLADRSGVGLFYYSNRHDEIIALDAGLYGLSNHLLDTPWPKVQRGKRGLQEILELGVDISPEVVLKILGDQTLAPDAHLPDTGIGLPLERLLSPIFITSSDYGTRSSSVILMDEQGEITFVERAYPKFADRIVEAETHSFKLTIGKRTG